MKIILSDIPFPFDTASLKNIDNTPPQKSCKDFSLRRKCSRGVMVTIGCHMALESSTIGAPDPLLLILGLAPNHPIPHNPHARTPTDTHTHSLFPSTAGKLHHSLLKTTKAEAFPKKQWLPLCSATQSTPPRQFSQEPTSQLWFPRTSQ